MIVVGLTSGTSADGIDAAVVSLRGAPARLDWQLLAHITVPYAAELRERIFAAFRPETGTVDQLCRLNFELGEAFADAALAAMDAAHLKPSDVALIGSHGQTVWHEPPTETQGGATLQIGSAAVIAERTGITTISDFRARDVAAGGHGAPLVSFLDGMLFRHPTRTRTIQNIGGIANVTVLPPLSSTRDVIAFDTGPGNMLIDFCAVCASAGVRWSDRDGDLAARGHVSAPLLDELIGHPYLRLPPPKTTGREVFGAQFGAEIWQRGKALKLSDEDIVATVTAFTAESIVRAYRDFVPVPVDEMYLAGGGAHNRTLVEMIRARVAPVQVHHHDVLGLSASAKEAVLFAVLAYETYHGRAGNLPTATGARHAVVLGDITPGKTPAAHRRADTSSLTEARNPATADIDTLPTLEMLHRINDADARVADAVREELPHIAVTVDAIADRLRAGGRLIYIGAGTSGRLGVLDAAEIPPTFGVPPDRVVALIAGGERAITQSIEGAEDDAGAGERDVSGLNVSERDAVVGIAASGETRYVLGGMAEAKRRGAFVVGVACNHPSPMEQVAQLVITPLVGPEVLTGSTRLKAGTAQKMVLNMISTGVMIRLGKTFGNLMVDVQLTNTKLRARARRIVEQACGLSATDAEALLSQCDGQVKTAIVMALARVSPEQARRRLNQANGSIRAALNADDHT